MSDANPPPANAVAVDADERRRADRLRAEQRRAARALRLGAFGLLSALAALALATLAGWRVLALERARDADRDAARLALNDLELIRAQSTRLETRAAADAAALAALAPLPQQFAKLGERVAVIEARIEAPQRSVARVEAAELIELANDRLEFERDVRGASVLYAAAEQRLAAFNDAALLGVRAQLERDLATLRALPEPDSAAIGARLAAASARVRELPMLGMIQDHYLARSAAPAAGSGLARAWQQFTTSLRDLVSVRRISDASLELVSMEEIGVRRQHLETLLLTARLAALRADGAEYAASVGAARDWLGRFFDARDTRVRALGAELAELAGAAVNPPLPAPRAALRLLRGPGR